MSIIKPFSKHANKTKRVERYRIIKFLGIIIFLFFFVCFKKVFFTGPLQLLFHLLRLSVKQKEKSHKFLGTKYDLNLI